MYVLNSIYVIIMTKFKRHLDLHVLIILSRLQLLYVILLLYNSSLARLSVAYTLIRLIYLYDMHEHIAQHNYRVPLMRGMCTVGSSTDPCMMSSSHTHTHTCDLAERVLDSP